MKKVKVPLGERSYEIQVGQGLLERLGPACRKLKLARRCAVIADERVVSTYGRSVMQSLRQAGFEAGLIQVPAGERSKSLRTVRFCYDQLADRRLERSSFVVALGGGVVGDLAGFVAATYLRGVGFVQVPTTLLAQVDSSVGGKVGVNLRAGKNLVGAFHQPRLVLCDLDTLRSLPARELRAGLAEVIKYGVIADARLFARLEKNLSRLLKLDADVLASVVARCCQIKAEVVAADEKEGGRRAILNFGHTIGHAIENSAGYGRFLHGEAISIGQVAAAHLSSWQLGFSPGDVDRVRGLLTRAGLPTSLHLGAARRRKLLEAMKLDKKVSEGSVKFVLAESIGEVRFGQTVPEQQWHRVLDVLGEGTAGHSK